MRLENDTYQVEIAVDTTYTVDSADNMNYDYIFNPDGKRHSDISTTFAIKVNSLQKGFSAALIGSLYSYENDCAVLERDALIVLQGHRITEINLKSIQIERNKKLDMFGAGYAVYPCPKGYLIYGELEVIMLNRGLDEIWEFGGRDVFILCQIEDDTIHLQDWDNTEYILDMDGNLKSERPCR